MVNGSSHPPLVTTRLKDPVGLARDRGRYATYLSLRLFPHMRKGGTLLKLGSAVQFLYAPNASVFDVLEGTYERPLPSAGTGVVVSRCCTARATPGGRTSSGAPR
jgi:hypothetical protein